ncbi:MAG: TraR/DksA family transcriptional regulator [Patescibacteria group bacterium]
MHDQQFLDSIKEKLLVEKKRLEEELGRLGTKIAGSSEYQAAWEEYGSSEEDNAAEVAAYGDSLSLTTTLEEELKGVDESLERLEKGAYGICAQCGTEIATERLNARPMSILCVTCQAKSETA